MPLPIAKKSSSDQTVGMSYRKSFPPGVVENIRSYVYMLLDPRTDSPAPFYVGKGTGNRIFDHLNEAIQSPNVNDKLETIRAIHSAGKEVIHVILRHQLSAETAVELEAAFLDYLHSLTNLKGGTHSNTRGLMNVEEVIADFEAAEATITEPCILIRINRLWRRGMTSAELLEATRKSWVIGKARERAQYGIAVAGGIVRQVYKIEKWKESIESPGRWEFEGTVATELREKYVGGSVAQYFKPGAANPIRYLNTGQNNRQSEPED